EGEALQVRHRAARLQDVVGRQRRTGDTLVERVEAAEPLAIDDDDAASLGEEVAAAGEGRSGGDAGVPERRGEASGRLVLADVAGLEAGGRPGGSGGPGEGRGGAGGPGAR